MSSLSDLPSAAAINVQVGGIGQLKFTGKASDYDVWKKRIISHLRFHEMYEVVESSPESVSKVGSEAGNMGVLVASDASVASVNDGDEVKDNSNTVAIDAANNAGASSSSSSGADGAKKKASKKEVEKQKEALLLAAAKLQKKRDQAYHVIVNCLADSLIREFGSLLVEGDPHSAWKCILAKYERKTMPTKHALREKWSSMKMERGEDFATYCGRVSQLVDRMRSVGISIGEDDIIHTLLHGLPKVYDVLKQVLKTSQQELVLESVKQQIQDFEEEINLKAKEEERQAHWTTVETANSKKGNRAAYYNQARGNEFYDRNNHTNAPATRGQQSSGSGSTRADIVCYVCNKSGHVMFDCPNLPSTTPKCTQCRMIGHTMANCKRNGAGNYRGRGGFTGRGGYRGGRSNPYQERNNSNGSAMSASRENEWEINGGGNRRNGSTSNGNQDHEDEYGAYYVARERQNIKHQELPVLVLVQLIMNSHLYHLLLVLVPLPLVVN